MALLAGGIHWVGGSAVGQIFPIPQPPPSMGTHSVECFGTVFYNGNPSPCMVYIAIQKPVLTGGWTGMGAGNGGGSNYDVTISGIDNNTAGRIVVSAFYQKIVKDDSGNAYLCTYQGSRTMPLPASSTNQKVACSNVYMTLVSKQKL
jgi:hypothetical protein